MNRSSGFTLIETLVALLLLQFALLALIPMFVHATRATAGSGKLGTVGVIATQRMELLREIPFATLTAGGSLTTNEVGFSDTSAPGFIERWRVTDDASPPTLKTLEVRVISVQDLGGVPNEITMVNIAAQEPL